MIRIQTSFVVGAGVLSNSPPSLELWSSNSVSPMRFVPMSLIFAVVPRWMPRGSREKISGVPGGIFGAGGVFAGILAAKESKDTKQQAKTRTRRTGHIKEVSLIKSAATGIAFISRELFARHPCRWTYRKG